MLDSKKHGLRLIKLLKSKKIYPYFRILEDSRSDHVIHNNKKLVMMGSNNYLGLTHDPRVMQAAIDAIKKWGVGCTGSRFLNGNLLLHEELEENLADFLAYDSCLVYAAGFMANLAIASFTDENTDIFSDEENHACIIEGCKLTKAQVHVYKHSDMNNLEEKLKTSHKKDKLIITDGVFSMKGDIVPLDKMTDLAEQYNAKIYLDDAHGLGVIGKEGRGTSSHYSLCPDIIMGTFSKSLATQGGYICSSHETIEWIKHRSRSFMFSAGLSPANTAAANTALNILRAEPERINQQRANAKYLRDQLKQAKLDIVDSQTSIIPILIGDDQATLIICQKLLDIGVFTTPVMYPAVPRGQALIRCSVIATHTKRDLDTAAQAFTQLSDQIIQAYNASGSKDQDTYFDIFGMSPESMDRAIERKST